MEFTSFSQILFSFRFPHKAIRYFPNSVLSYSCTFSVTFSLALWMLCWPSYCFRIYLLFASQYWCAIIRSWDSNFFFKALHICEYPGDLWGLETKHKGKGNFRICFILISILYTDLNSHMPRIFFSYIGWIEQRMLIGWNIPKAVKKCPMTLVPCTGWITSSHHHGS